MRGAVAPMGIEVTLRLGSMEAYLRSVHKGPRELAVSEIRVLNRYAADILTDIEDAWPVDTSTSRDAFQWTLADDGIAIVIENDTDYAEYVHRKGTPPDPPLFETLIPEVWESYKPALISDLRAAIDATERTIAIEAQYPDGLRASQIIAGKVPPVRRTPPPAALPAKRRRAS
jgi:hypothetical protein